ncbi:MAG: hypothetical protein ACPLSY_03420 [Moorellaceae bacterium]
MPIFNLPGFNRTREDPREYFKLLPANDYEYDARAALNLFYLMAGANKKASLLGPPPFRFLAHVARGRVALYFGCPPEYSGVVRGAFAGSYPRVFLAPTSSPVANWAGGALTEFYAAGGRFLPFRQLQGPPSVLVAVLTALGAGRDTPVEAVLDVCFAPLPEAKIREEAEAEALRYEGVQAGGVWGEIKEALLSPAVGHGTGDQADARRVQGQVRILHPSRATVADGIRRRFLPPERSYEVTVRLVARGGPKGSAEKCIMDAASAMAAMSYANRLERSGHHGHGDRVALGGFGERVVMSSGELANLVVVPGPDSPLWAVLERDVARTVAPPGSLLRDGDEEL